MLNENIQQLRQWLQAGEAPIIPMRFFLEVIAPELTRRHRGEVIADDHTRSLVLRACAGLLGTSTPELAHMVQLRVRFFQLQHGVFGIEAGQGSYCYFEDLRLGALMLITNQYGVWFGRLF